jgi:hypothetical protein
MIYASVGITMSRHTPHALYLPPISRDNADAADATVRVMSYLTRIKPELSRMGIWVDVHRIRQKDIRNPRVQAALRDKEVDALPSILAAGRTHVGIREIETFYENLLHSGSKHAQSSGSKHAQSSGSKHAQSSCSKHAQSSGPRHAQAPIDNPEDADAADALDEFYREEMGFGRHDEGDSYRARFNFAADDMGLDVS